MTPQERKDRAAENRKQKKERRALLRVTAIMLYPYPTNGNTHDPEDFKVRCKKVDNERLNYIIRNL